MKKIVILCIILFSNSIIISQVINIKYTSNSLQGGVCVKEEHIVSLSDNIYTRIDLFDNSKISEKIELKGTGYDDAGLYWELWTPVIPDNININNLNKITNGRRIIKVYYLSRKKDVLNITEVFIDTNQYRYFFTELAGGILCNKY